MSQGGDFVIIMADNILRDDVIQEVDSCGVDPYFIWREFHFVEAQTRKTVS